ncbi:mannose-1-phosphate guanylyltransferase/mannose-6-phosphate isomerase [Ramlibacter monticola]
MLSSPPNIRPVILCGGSGTRLWPLSRKAFPKQFIPLVGGKSLLQLTVERLAALGPQAAANMLVVCGEEHRFMVQENLEAAGGAGQLILEPAARNTAPAIALAALAAHPGDLLLICPSDHHVPDSAAFAQLVKSAVPAAEEGAIVTFGVVPSFPSTAYGYIEQGEPRASGGSSVVRFIEKPPAELAEQLVLGGKDLWNAGIFFCRADTLLDALLLHCPDILGACEVAVQAAVRDGSFIRPDAGKFAASRSESIDYAVMQKHRNTVVFPFSGAWSDVGSWNAAADLTPADTEGNRVVGAGRTVRSQNTFIHAPHRPVVALGVSDLLIVDTPDAVLVAARDAAEEVRQVVIDLEASNNSQAVMHRKVFRPWGWYDSVDNGDRFQVKRICVKPGASLSLQMHHHRAEHWIVVRGTAEVTCGGKTFTLTENQSTYIPIGETHRLRNPGRIGLELIEVQSGSYLGEDDIVRLEDTYGRAPASAESN